MTLDWLGQDLATNVAGPEGPLSGLAMNPRDPYNPITQHRKSAVSPVSSCWCYVAGFFRAITSSTVC
ncbi:uncharacterized protein J3R85_011695 [Psidium guajava]|nr:uncharacterized protein J3R85_011695 [Psidium guajava]